MGPAEEVLDYWFGPLEGPTDFNGDRMKLWWMGGADVDREIGERFGNLVRSAQAGELGEWQQTPRGALALVILLDQFTRNLGRGTKGAFAGDERALEVCLGAIERAHDQELRPIERAFLYMPLMHAESREIAKKSVATFEELSRYVKATCSDTHPDFVSHAVEHAAIVERFGRYPHRNQILDRETTAEEQAFLAGGGPNFGQRKS